MKKYLLLLIILSLAICFIPANANATIHTFKDPTGVFTTGIFPKNEQGKYQRDIEWDFNLDPTINNQDADYNGYMDDDLKSEDLIDLFGDDITYEVNKIGIPKKDSGLSSGAAMIGINNTSGGNYKFIYFELEFYTNMSESDMLGYMSQWSIGFDIFTDPEFTDGGYIPDHSILDEALHPDLDLQYDEPYYYGLIYMLFWFEPNPSYEGIYFAFNDIDNTDEFWVTQANVVTHCTPIPTSAWLLGSGLIGIVGIRRKFQK